MLVAQRCSAAAAQCTNMRIGPVVGTPQASRGAEQHGHVPEMFVQRGYAGHRHRHGRQDRHVLAVDRRRVRAAQRLFGARPIADLETVRATCHADQRLLVAAAERRPRGQPGLR